MTDTPPVTWSTPTTGELAVLVAELDRRVDQRFEQNDKALAAALLAAKEAVAAALTAAKEAVDKAELAASKRFEATNEFRGQLSDQATTFQRRDLADQQYETLRALIAALTTRIDTRDGERHGHVESGAVSRANLALVLTAVGLVVVVVIALLAN